MNKENKSLLNLSLVLLALSVITLLGMNTNIEMHRLNGDPALTTVMVGR